MLVLKAFCGRHGHTQQLSQSSQCCFDGQLQLANGLKLLDYNSLILKGRKLGCMLIHCTAELLCSSVFQWKDEKG